MPIAVRIASSVVYRSSSASGRSCSRCRSTDGARGNDVVGHDERTIGEPSRRLGCGEQVDRGARARAEGDARQLARSPNQRDHVPDDLVAHGCLVDEGPQRP